MKRGKEIKLDIKHNYNTRTGTVDNKSPKSVYVIISGWANPNFDSEINYNKVISDLNKRIKDIIYKNIDKNRFNHEQFIIDLDMRESGIKFNKRSYMCCEINLFQNNNITLEAITSNLLLDSIKEITNNVLNEAFESCDYFTFYKTKK